jgi:hypothetical protein
MAKFQLTERQKDLLRSIAPALEADDGNIKTEWGLVYGDNRIMGIMGLEGDIHNYWFKNAQISDFNVFAQQGLFIERPNSRYSLNAQAIIDAVRGNFGDSPMEIENGRNGEMIVNPIFGQPPANTQYQADVFMVMPFKEELSHVYEAHIKQVMSRLNLTIKRGDDFFTNHAIIGDIWGAINHSRLVIADCTGRNPNVFYELGIAHTIGKPAIMIAQNEADFPFDIRHFRFIHYQPTSEGLLRFETTLQDAIIKLLSLKVV